MLSGVQSILVKMLILYISSLKKYCDYDFYCYTDDPTGIDSNINIIDIPSKPALKVWWNKLPMFNKDFPLHGKTIFFDLDVYITTVVHCYYYYI